MMAVLVDGWMESQSKRLLLFLIQKVVRFVLQ